MTDLQILMYIYSCDIKKAYKYLHDSNSHFVLAVYKRGYEKGLEEGWDNAMENI